MPEAVMGDFASTVQVERVVSHLRAAGVPPGDISVIIEQPYTDTRAERSSEDVIAGATTGTASGAILGGLAGWVLSLGAWNLWGVGSLAAQYGFGATAAGAAVGAALLGLLGGIAGLGFGADRPAPEEDRDVLLTVLARTLPPERIEGLMKENEAFNVQRTQDLPEPALTTEPTAFQHTGQSPTKGTPMVRPGQDVFTLDDDKLGEVREAVGEFFTVRRGFLQAELYIPFEDVHDIRPDTVYVNAIRDEVELKGWDVEPRGRRKDDVSRPS